MLSIQSPVGSVESLYTYPLWAEKITYLGPDIFDNSV